MPRPPLNRDTTLCISLSGRPSNHGIKFHNYLYEKHGLDYLYKAMTTTDIEGAIAGVRALGIRGCSVSMPFKQAVIPLMDEVDHSAQVIGAVNTIVNTDGHLHAYNTDVIAVASLLKSHAVDPKLPFLLRGSGGMAAAVAGAAVLVLWYLDLTDQSYAHVEEWRLFADMALLFLFNPFALAVVGIVQTRRKAAPSAFVAAAALTPFSILVSFDSFRFVYFTVILVLLITTMALLLVAACMCLWGRLPHCSHTPRSVVSVSALAMTSIWLMTIKLLMMWINGYAYYQNYNYTVLAWIAIALKATSLVCGIALLVLMIFHRKVIIMRILAVLLGALVLTDAGLSIIYGRALDLPVFSIPAAALLIALAVPVFCASFKQWCAGTWTAPAWKPSAVAGRPTILARTSQVTDPDGNTLNDDEIAAMLPTTRPTFWVSLFFGLFGLLPMLTANSTARSLGVVTNAYNSAMLKGFVLGILMWTAITAASYTIILFGLL